MAVIGTHALLYTSEPDAVRAIFRDVFGLGHVDAGISFRGEPVDEGYGISGTMALPGGLDMLLYEPKHPTAI